jgi:HD-GYP domain-containing protein (c-di-GMP phosphodiesterase class II)
MPGRPTGQQAAVRAADARGEIESEDRALQRNSLALISAVFVSMKVALMHRVDNKAFQDAMASVVSALDTFRRTCAPTAAVQFVGDATYVNRTLIRVPVTLWDSVRFVRRILERFGAGELLLTEEFQTASFAEFLTLVKGSVAAADPRSLIADRTFTGLQLRELRARMGQFEAVSMSARLRVLRAYGVATLTLRDVVHKVAAGRNPPIVPLKRAMQDVASLPPETAPQQLSLLSLERYRQELAGRMMNVALLSMRIGDALGLQTALVRDLGLVAALHDIGRASRPDLQWASPDSAGASSLHLESVRHLTALRTGGVASLLRTVVAFEAGQDSTLAAQHPMTRIIAVASSYEWMTQNAARGGGMLPDEALRELLRASGSRFDPLVVKALVNTIGLYPVGTTVRLSTGETAVVLEVPSDPAVLKRPRVKILAGADGRATAGRICDLSETPEVSIVGSVDARELDVNIGFYFFS